ncbi:MAG: hypothetical protein ACOYN4_11435 [Bacteroidales bacterium]
MDKTTDFQTQISREIAIKNNLYFFISSIGKCKELQEFSQLHDLEDPDSCRNIIIEQFETCN